MAAVLACGEGALLSGRAAAHRFGLIGGTAPEPEITAPRRCRIKGLRTKQCADPGPSVVYRGVPSTSVARTLVDLAAVLPEDELAKACHEAGVRFGTTPREVQAVLARRPNAPGARLLKEVVAGRTKVVLSTLEKRFLDLLREHGLPLPETNRPAGGRRVDCRWPDRRLTVELDSYTYHRSRRAWELDRRRERDAYLRGDDFRRYTRGDVFDHPRLMLRELEGLLQAGEASSTRTPSGSRTKATS